MELKKIKIIILPAEKYIDGKVLIHMAYDNPKQLWVTTVNKEEDNTVWIPQHLYFLSDEEIKEGDWCFHLGFERLEQWYNNIELDISLRRKIVATTDITLREKQYKAKRLPRPTKSFIKEYCKLGGINEVDIEYRWATANGNSNYKTHKILKVNSHNEIIIHLIKDSWTREELYEIFSNPKLFSDAWTRDDIDEQLNNYKNETNYI